jgi:hypothetical protein
MADDSLEIKITANVSDAQAGAKAVQDAFNGIKGAAERLQTALARTGGDNSVGAIGKALREMASEAEAGAATTTAAIQGIDRAAAAGETTRKVGTAAKEAGNYALY